MIRELRALPDVIRRTLHCHDDVRRIAERYAHAENFLYLGRQYLYPLALEGALKLKEISYVHAEGYPTGETKHGPLALIDDKLPVVIVATRDLRDPGSVLRYEKTVANIKSFKQQGGRVIAAFPRFETQNTTALWAARFDF